MKKLLSEENYDYYSRYVRKKAESIDIGEQTEEWLVNHYDTGRIPMLSSIEIEIINRCNGECPFCPVNRHDEKRKFARMTDELFYKIINELGDMDYRGRLALHSNNEPFLDKRIISFARYAREHVPNAFIYMYTNGTLLTLEKFKEIIPYLSKIYIDNYNDDLKLHENIQEIHNYCKRDKALNRKVEIHVRKIHEVLNTRGGQSPNNLKKQILSVSCILPFKQMVVRPDGKVSLCCNDPYGRYTLADLNQMSIKEAWHSEQYQKVRKRIRIGRKHVKLCRYCDTLVRPDNY
jgi:radical SAM protein with 4Fe4S-binding SPASM domain